MQVAAQLGMANFDLKTDTAKYDRWARTNDYVRQSLADLERDFAENRA